MKICLINSLYKPLNRGGSEIIIARQAQEYRDLGHEVVVITTAGEHKDSVEKADGVKVYRLSPRNIFTYYKYASKPLLFRLIWLALDIFNLPMVKAVRKILEIEKPQRVHSHNLRGLSYLVPKAIKGLKIQHYHTLHDIQLIYPSGLLVKGSGKYKEDMFYNNFFLQKLYEKLTSNLFGSPTKVVSPSKWLLKLHAEKGFFKISKKIVRPPIIPINYKYLDLKLNGGRGDVLKLLYVGQMEEHKGILFLIDTIKKISNFKFQISIVGTGSDSDAIKKTIDGDQRFTIHGHVPQENIGKYYKQADVTLVPSLTYENAPTVIFESFAFGTPILASRIGGIPEFIEEGKTGWLFEPGDKKDLIKKLQEI